MRRGMIVLLTASAVLASVANPHFLGGGAYDVHGLAPRWQSVVALVDLTAAAVAGWLLLRGKPTLARTIVACELALYQLLTAASVWRVGTGYFHDGWGGRFYPAFALALASRALLLLIAHRMQTERSARSG